MSLTAEVDPADVLADFERRARRCETPCGDGTMVWRAWGDGPPVMLAHGAHGAWSHWIRNIDALAATRTVWAADLPGFGDSAVPPGPDHEAYSGVLAEGLRRLVGADLPVDVVGFSFGGVACAQLAARHPELVRRLVLVDTGGLATPLGTINTQRVRGLEGEARLAAVRSNLLSLMLRHPDSIDAMALHLQAINPRRGRIDPLPYVLPDRLLQALPHVRAPVCAIWGEFDGPHPHPSVQEAALRRLRPELQFRVIPGAGHWSMYEGAAAFNRVALELLEAPV